MPPADALQFDYILIGSTNKDKLIEDFAKANLSFPFADYFSIEAYHQVSSFQFNLETKTISNFSDFMAHYISLLLDSTVQARSSL